MRLGEPRTGRWLQGLAETSSRQGEIVKRIGLALLMATLAPAAFAAGTYTEVWNPPEARATTPSHVRTTRKLAAHRHVVPHAVKVHGRRTPATAPRLLAKQSSMQKTLPKDEPDMFEIPRQITPEGNVLRVTGHAASARVVR
jgi:hypothetical protein